MEILKDKNGKVIENGDCLRIKFKAGFKGDTLTDFDAVYKVALNLWRGVRMEMIKLHEPKRVFSFIRLNASDFDLYSRGDSVEGSLILAYKHKSGLVVEQSKDIEVLPKKEAEKLYNEYLADVEREVLETLGV